MPHLVKVQEKYEKKGMVLIAQHRQAASLKGKVLALANSRGVNYTITQGGMLSGDKSRGIPRAWLFDWTGKKVWEGHPSQVDGPLESLMKKAPHWLCRGRELSEKKVLGYSYKLFANRSYGSIVKSLNDLIEKGADKEDATKEVEEATFLRDNIVGYGKDQLALAKTLERTDPIKGYETYARLKSLFKGHEVGEQAKTRYDELKKDKAFKEELSAGKYFKMVNSLIPKISGDLTKSSNQRVVGQIAGIARTMNKRWPTSVYTAKVRQIAAGYGVKLQ